jgi:2-alkenal reductase
MTANQPKNRKLYPTLLVIVLIMMTGLACQLSSVSLVGPDSAGNDEELVNSAVATITAGQAVIDQEPEVEPEVVVATPITEVEIVPEVATADAPLPPAVSALDLDLEQTLVELYRKVNPSVVHIFVFDQNISFILGTGSGFVYDAEGHIVTNNHVVEGGERLEVAFANGERRRATIVGTDTDSDLAVIKVDSLPAGVQPIPVGDSDSVEVGQFVVAIGNPFGEAGSMSVGVISGLGRTLPTQRIADGGGQYSIPQVIQTDAAINPGNSGGPLLNLKGEVVGVNSAILTRTGTNTGVGFSVPSKAIELVVPALIADGEFIYPFMGISMADVLPLDMREEFGVNGNGIYVRSVVPDTPAARAGVIGCCAGFPGLRPGGDYIIAVDGQPLTDSAELISYLVFETQVGDTIELTVLREGEEITLPLTLEPRP